eukprot:m.171330 g.171330  ORF g.171330 m.171330 type:complete len:458 (+) comp15349_c0_seq1:286-1659(+)
MSGFILMTFVIGYLELVVSQTQWITRGKNQYLFEERGDNGYDDAVNYCRSKGGYLVWFDSPEEQTWVSDTFKFQTRTMCNDVSGRGTFEFANPGSGSCTRASGYKWREGEPNNVGVPNEGCTLAYEGFGDSTCLLNTYILHILCKATPSASFSTAMASSVSRTPSPWITRGQNRYLFVERHDYGYDDAVNFCQNQGGYLVWFDSPEEQTWVSDTFKAQTRSLCNDLRRTGNFEFASPGKGSCNRVAGYKWRDGEPNGAAVGENCTLVYQGFGDTSCGPNSYILYILCKTAVTSSTTIFTNTVTTTATETVTTSTISSTSTMTTKPVTISSNTIITSTNNIVSSVATSSKYMSTASSFSTTLPITSTRTTETTTQSTISYAYTTTFKPKTEAGLAQLYVIIIAFLVTIVVVTCMFGLIFVFVYSRAKRKKRKAYKGFVTENPVYDNKNLVEDAEDVDV